MSSISIYVNIEEVEYECNVSHAGFSGLTVVNQEERLGVVVLFFVFARHVLGQQVECLVSAVTRHLLTRHHLQQGQQNGLQVLVRVCKRTNTL